MIVSNMSIIQKGFRDFCKFPKVLLCSLHTSSVSQAHSAESPPQRISPNLSFRPAASSLPDDRPLVLLYGWLVAKARHVHKYGDFYLGHGFDVLHIKVAPQQVLWPSHAQDVVRQLLDFADSRPQQPVLVHGFSVGGYLFGETLVQLKKEKYSGVATRIKAQIWDSPVDVHGIPSGVSKAITEVPIIQKPMEATLAAYLNTFRNSVTKHYHRSSEAYRENGIKAPGLFLYSRNDAIACPETIEDVMHGWRKQGIEVTSKCWPDSKHVSHFMQYPVEYIMQLNEFLRHVGLLHEQEEKKQCVAMGK